MGLLWLLAAPLALAESLPGGPPLRDAEAAEPGIKSCLRCHDQPHVTAVLTSPHGVTADARTKGAACTACHGESVEHQRKLAEGAPRPKPDIVFTGAARDPVVPRNGACLGCHEGGLRHDWLGSAHQRHQLGCTDCHAAHVTRDPVLTRAGQAETCFTCHRQQRAESARISHHPLREGVVLCADCHNPHGAVAPHMLVGVSITDTCLACHADKRGPFLWEHPPVTEDCTLCHTPHGTNHPRLLKNREPYLCQTCHDSGVHVSQGFSGANLNNGARPSVSMSLKSCTTCHAEIHGSNHPSGVRRTR